MTNKELKKLSRRELLEMLLDQSKEVERLRRELKEAKRQLNDRRILIENAGSIAEAALKLNKVFEAAQDAANQYLENIMGMQEDLEEGMPRPQSQGGRFLAESKNDRQSTRDGQMS